MGSSTDAMKYDAKSRRFAAFISYSHADAAAAADLQQRLERYRLPRHIAGADTHSPSLGSIFRDREDLAAASNLTSAIRDAIAQADALIVMCSPDAAASPWVDAEIKLFRECHPDRPILAVLLSGTPARSFPPALTAGGVEPLAADLRKDGDGPQLGFLKIVAGIAAVPLDALIQRDAQRRIRRVTAITVGALAAMLVMGVMTGFAISARNEATRQRAASDGLVEYMLTDLREKLRGVGRSDIMNAVNRRALDHYATQGDLGQLPADSLEHRARVLHAMGEDEERAGELTFAIQRFGEAHATTAALLEREPNNPDRIFAHAQSEYYVGRIYARQNNRAATERYWRGYFQQAQALSKVEPQSHRSHMELGYAEGNLCELALQDNYDLKAAERHCRAAIAHEERALAAKPGDSKTRQDIANRWGWLARVQHATGDHDSVVVSRGHEALIMDGLLREDPINVEYALRKAWAVIGASASLLKLGKPLPVLTSIRDALPRFERVTAAATGDERVIFTRQRLLSYRARAEQDNIGRVDPQTQSAIEDFIGSQRQSVQLRDLHRKIMEED